MACVQLIEIMLNLRQCFVCIGTRDLSQFESVFNFLLNCDQRRLSKFLICRYAGIEDHLIRSIGFIYEVLVILLTLDPE